MMNELPFFPEKKTGLAVLEQFVAKIDEYINELGLEVMNHPGVCPMQFQMNIDAQRVLVNSPVSLVYTTQGVIFTTTPASLKTKQPITLATSKELAEYYESIALAIFTGDNTTPVQTNCEGFAAVALEFAKDLLKHRDYQHIEVRVCSLTGWGHIFLEVHLPDEGISLCYDPWYQRTGLVSDASIPFTFTPENANNTIQSAISTLMDKRAIDKIHYVQDYNPKTRMLSSEPHINPAHLSTYLGERCQQFDYEVIHTHNKAVAPKLEQNSCVCVIS